MEGGTGYQRMALNCGGESSRATVWKLQRCRNLVLGTIAVAVVLPVLCWIRWQQLASASSIVPGCEAGSIRGASRSGSVAVGVHAGRAYATSRPVIAILASPCDPPITDPEHIFQCDTYLPASYVRWVQQAGAQVVPLHRGMSDKLFDELLSQVNGAMTIGGFFKENGTAEPLVTKIWNHAQRLADQGEWFPLWGTCLGFDDFVQLSSGVVYREFLSPTQAADVTFPLKFTEAALTSSAGDLFDEATLPGASMSRRWFAEMNISYHHHSWGLEPSTFAALPGTSEMFEVVATAKDLAGLEFIALMQGRTRPIFASAFHPEKPAFEWNSEGGALTGKHIPHTREAVIANLHLASAFVDHARLNSRNFTGREVLLKHQIGNQELVYTAALPQPVIVNYFDECYVFGAPSSA